MLKRCFVAALLMIGFCFSALGQALADRVPADAVLYIGWRGSDALTADYGKSNLKKLVDQTALEKNLGELMPTIVKRVAQDQPAAEPIARAVSELLPILWHKPCAVYFGGASITPTGLPNVKFSIICDAGGNPAGLIKSIKDISSRTGAPISSELHAGQYVAIGVVYPVPDSVSDLLATKTGDSLAGSAAFKSSISKTSPNAAMTAYFDSTKMVKMVDELMGANVPPQTKASWQKAKEALVLDGIKSLVMTCGFDNADWSTRVFIDAPAPRKGIASLLESTPISADMLKQIPIDSTHASASKLNLNELFKGIVSLAGQFSPPIPAQVDRAMAQIKQKTQVDIQNDLLASMGDEWGMYTSPSVAGNSAMGMVVVNKLANPAKFMEAVKKLETLGNKAMEENFRREKISISIRPVTVGKNEVHYLTIPFAAPAFAVRDGVLYMGLYPQTVIAAMDYAAGNGKGIGDNPQFAAISKKLGGGKLMSFTYTDLPKLAPESYSMLLLVNRLGVGFADMAGIPMPEPMLPTLPQFMKVLTPAGSASWQDDSGFYMRSTSPFPAAGVLGSGGDISPATAIGTTSVMVSVMLPALNAAKERANRVKCASNLRQIAQGCQLYNADQRKYPANPGLLVTEVDLSPEVFICPSGNTTVPGGLTPQQQAKWVNENSDYVYLGGTMKANMDADTVLAYEKPDNHDGDGVNVVFNDGHVDWFTMPQFEQVMARDKQLKGK